MVSYARASGVVVVREVVMLGVSLAIALLSHKYVNESFWSLKQGFTQAEALKPKEQPASHVDSASVPIARGMTSTSRLSTQKRIDG